MKVQFTPQLLMQKRTPQIQQKQQNHKVENTFSYNPIGYQDYNVSFGARLFRTPENFYEQDFNEQNMPETLHKYIYESTDSNFRKTIPPAQAMKEVFGKINYAKDLDAVKKMFPDEPLFENLTSTPNKKSREGLLGIINLMKNDPSYEGKTLFKNGNNDLGMYILKKIYVEGKTLKEINKDFSKDVSVYFKSYAIKPQDYNAFGIRFPNNSFWHSFIVTREDFPYVYIPRGPQSEESQGIHSGKTSNVVSKKPVEKNKFEDVKNWEVEKLADALIKGNGSQEETEKQMKKRGVPNKDSMNFVAQYMGEINSVVLEKLHISDDMKDYFENYKDLSKTQREKFDEYMKNPYINDLRSEVMSATIRFFFDVYGVDGNNEEFQDLLEYARNIKPNRIARNEEHNRLQAEYEAALGIFSQEPEEMVETIPAEIDKAENKEISDEDLGVEGKDYFIMNSKNGGTVRIIGTAEDMLTNALVPTLRITPLPYAEKIVRHTQEHEQNTEAFRFGLFARNTDAPILPDERFMPAEDAINLAENIYYELVDQDLAEETASQQAILDLFLEHTEGVSPKIFRLTTFGLNNLYEKINDKEKIIMQKKRPIINRKFNEYKKPLTANEKNKIIIEMLQLIRNYDRKNSIINEGSKLTGFENLMEAMKICLTGSKKREYKEILKIIMNEALEPHGGSSRFLLKDNVDPMYKQAKLETILSHYCTTNSNELLGFIASDKDVVEYLKYNNLDMYNAVKDKIHLQH